MTCENAMSRLELNREASIERLIDWLRIPSVSTDPEYKDDVARAAQWAADELRTSGFDVEIRPTGDPEGSGHPVVLATTPGQDGYTGPHVLFYGHYDVQPADPLELWDSPPFEPTRMPAEGEVGERIVARGAVDDKGQVACFLEAVRAWKETGSAPGGGVRFTVLLEGEEESGSVNLERFVKQHAEELGKTDICLISDTGMLGRGKPAITYGVRGLSYTEITLHGPNQDLHSGMWGGKAPNPINELTKVLAKLWDSDRRVAIPGFYDDVRPIEDAERAAWKKLGIDEKAQLANIGYPPEASVGEAGYSFIEREWARPTAEINGIWGGYTGHGAKTVIASHASAKVSFRLVADQDPAKISVLFFDWLRERTPPGCRWELHDHGGGWGVTVSTESEILQAATRALERASGVKPELIKTGGSIPVGGLLKSELGLETIFMGFGLDDDRVHSPNEKFELSCFDMGCRAHVAMIDEMRTLGGLG